MVQLVGEGFQFRQCLTEALAVDVRVLFQASQCTGVAFQFLEHLGLEVGAAEDGHDIQQCGQRTAAVPVTFTAQMVCGLGKQELQSQKGPDALVKRLFVDDLLVHRLRNSGWLGLRYCPSVGGVAQM